MGRNDRLSKSIQKTSAAAFVLLVVLSAVAFAGRAVADENYYWYDGGQKKPLLMDAGLVAEFGVPPYGESAVKKAEPGATRVQIRGGGAAIWRVGSSKDILAKSADLKPGTGGVSPVFREARGQTGAILSLPGNVIVFFKSDWTDGKVTAWLAANKLEIVNKLNLGKTAYVLKSGPGLASLNLANKLQESGEVESAAPNWWRPLHKR